MAAGIILGLCVIVSPVLAEVMTQEVPVGSMAKIPCPSNDENHRFWFWQLYNDKVVGPDNYVNVHKYKFDVLTGMLYIRSVSTAEAGFYKCISRGITDKNINVESVELIVKHNCAGDDKEFEATLFQALIAVGVVLIVVFLVTVAYIFFKRKQGTHDLIDEHDGFDGIAQRRPYNETVTATASLIPRSGTDNQSLETDFPRVFKPTASTSHSPL